MFFGTVLVLSGLCMLALILLCIFQVSLLDLPPYLNLDKGVLFE